MRSFNTLTFYNATVNNEGGECMEISKKDMEDEKKIPDIFKSSTDESKIMVIGYLSTLKDRPPEHTHRSSERPWPPWSR